MASIARQPENADTHMTMEIHRKRLGRWLLGVGILHLAAAVVMAMFPGSTPFAFGTQEVESFATVMSSLASLFLFAGGMSGVVAGWMLLRRIPRARIIGLGASFFLLIVPPFGTIVGAYGIWFLFQEGIESTIEDVRRPLPTPMH